MAPSRFETNDEQLSAIGELHRVFTTNHVEYWLFGGWAVDFHAGQMTRAHADIDVAVWRADVDRVATLLEADGWRATGEGLAGTLAYERGVVPVEIAVLERDEDGIVYTPVDDGRGEWPQSAFGDERPRLEGVEAAVIALDALIEEKSSGYGDAQAHEKDRADVGVLAGLRNDST